MALRINCLLNDTSAVDDIKSAMQVFVSEKLNTGGGASFPSVYRALRSEGVEIDAESAGAIYNDVFGSYNDSRISSEDEVNNYIGVDIKSLINDIADDIKGESSLPEEKQIGNNSPGEKIAMDLTTLFQKSVFETVGAEKSDMLKMQQLVLNAAKTILPKKSQTKGSSVLSALQDFFNTESVEFETLSGGANTIRDLFSSVKDEINSMVSEISSKLDDDASLILKEKWDSYFNSFQNAAYDILLSQQNQNDLLKESLRQVKVNGVDVVINGNIKWSALIEHNKPDEIARSVSKLFREGVKYPDGEIVKFSSEQARRIGEYFQRIYDKKLSEKKIQKLNQNRSSNTSSKNLISDFIKDIGFFKLVKDKNGKLLLTQTDWLNALKSMKNINGKGLDLPKEKLRDFLKNKKNNDGSDKYSSDQIELVVNEFERTAAAKMLPNTSTPDAMQRLIALNNLNAGKAFQKEYSHALNNLVGVSGLTQKTMDVMKDLAIVSEAIVNAGNLVSNSTSSNPLQNSGAYAFQALQQLDRQAKWVMRQHRTTTSNGQLISKYVSDLLITAANSKLLNPGNIGENILTGTVTNLAETVSLLTTAPELKGFIGKSNSDLWKGWASHATGGVSDDIIADEDYKSDIQSGERLRGRNYYNSVKGAVENVKSGEYKKAAGRVAATIAQTPQYATSIASRIIMNTFDAGFNEAIATKSVAQAMYRALMDMSSSLTQEGKKKEALNEMSKILNVPKETQAELNKIAVSIKNEMQKAGIHPTSSQMAQMRSQMELVLYEQAMMNLNPELSPLRAREIVKAVVEGASNKTRALTGKKKLPVSAWNITASLPYAISSGATFLQERAYTAMQKAEKEGRLGAAAAYNLAGAAAQTTLGLFIGGAAKFAALGITATPLGFVSAVDFAMQAKRLQKEVDANDSNIADPGDIRKYAEIHGLIRSSVVRAALGSSLMTAAALFMMGDADDDEKDSMLANLMATSSGRNFVKKYGSIGIAVAAMSVYDMYDKKGKRLNASSQILEFLSQSLLQQDTQKSFFWDNLSKAKTGDEQLKTIFKGLNETIIPTYNFNQSEQFTRFSHVLESAMDRNDISKVLKDEQIASGIYKNAKDYGEIFLRNGMIDFLKRWASDREDVNRYINQ